MVKAHGSKENWWFFKSRNLGNFWNISEKVVIRSGNLSPKESGNENTILYKRLMAPKKFGNFQIQKFEKLLESRKSGSWYWIMKMFYKRNKDG